MYKILYYPNTTDIASIIKINNGLNLHIPTDNLNKDYKEYIKWTEEGNVAEEWKPEEV